MRFAGNPTAGAAKTVRRRGTYRRKTVVCRATVCDSVCKRSVPRAAITFPMFIGSFFPLRQNRWSANIQLTGPGTGSISIQRNISRIHFVRSHVKENYRSYFVFSKTLKMRCAMIIEFVRGDRLCVSPVEIFLRRKCRLNNTVLKKIL